MLSLPALTALMPRHGVAATSDAPRAAVLEFPDRWTGGATGALKLLNEAGFNATTLDSQTDPRRLGVNLIFFGSFANNGDVYGQYVRRFTEPIRSFLEAGGVVVAMTQSDQFEMTVPYLPVAMWAERGDEDIDRVLVVDAGHPLLQAWPAAHGNALSWPNGDERSMSWETLEGWRNMRVLLAAADGPRFPAMLEGQVGRGRVLISSLWLDKAWLADGSPYVSEAAIDSSRAFFTGLREYVQAVRAQELPKVVPTRSPADTPTGPLLGHIDDRTAHVWYRPGEPGTWRATLRDHDRRATHEQQLHARPEHDLTLTFRFGGLKPGRTYDYRLDRLDDQGAIVETLDGRSLKTAPRPDMAGRVKLAFGSCVSSTEFEPIWDRVASVGSQGMVLLGDSPYIDTTNLRVQRRKHRQLLQLPAVSRLFGQIPFWATWDDHDHGGGDTDGTLEGQAYSRKAFMEYRAMESYGERGEGIYTRFRFGPMEVFLIDARWFAQTEPSFADPTKPTMLGRQQWGWLTRSLLASDAPIKLLCTGVIWDDKGNREKDDWHTYRHEKQALFDFLAGHRISGVSLIGGDIHASRALKYDTENRLGYPLWQFISSPMHDSARDDLNPPHPNLVFGRAEPNVFLTVEADTTTTHPSVTATWVRMDGSTLYRVRTQPFATVSSGVQ